MTLTDDPSSSTLPDEWPELATRLLKRTVIDNPFIPKELHGFNFPSVPQRAFLAIPRPEILFGGAAGGGKSVSLLAGALQYVDVPGYSAILFRRTLTDLQMPGALLPMSHEWLSGTAAQWNGQEHQWTFPSGATLNFGYLKDAADHFRYKSAAFQYCGFDELTSFQEHQYRFMFSRLRKPAGMNVPLRCRSASNPGDLGHEWVKRRFIDTKHPDREFIPARLEDNPGLDKEAYLESLAQLDPVTRAQMRHGDWNIRPEGNLFKRAWFDVVDSTPPLIRTVRGWDLAATEETAGKDPDYTAGAKMGIDAKGECYLLNMLRVQQTPLEVERMVLQTANQDGYGVAVRLEQEPGSSGKYLVANYERMLMGFAVRGVPSTGDKVTRSAPFSAACERRAVKLVRGSWIDAFLDELTAFPLVAHDDQVDAAVNAFSELTQGITAIDSGFHALTASSR